MECQMIQRQPHHHPGPGHPGHHARPQIGLGMFRPPAPTPPEPHSPSLSSEERALFLARTQLLRAQTPFPGSPPSPFSALAPPPRPPLSPHLGLQHLWAQWAQLQQLNSALMTPHSAAAGQSPPPGPAPAAALFSSLFSQRFSPYVISSPSPPPPAETGLNMSPASSRSQSPVQVEA